MEAQPECFVYKPTVPRGPIAAMYSSPGPVYMLPSLVGKPKHDPRSVHECRPAWHLGIRHGKYKDDSGPGPAYNPNPRLTRTGHDGSPQYSLHSRPKDFTLHQMPGPGAYSPENLGTNYYNRAPAYSFGTRRKPFGTDQQPGPNQYDVDPMLCRTLRSQKKSAPAYSLTSRSKIGGFSEDFQKTPGPGNYVVPSPGTYLRRAPGYSLTGRNQMPSDTTQKPGPGTYYYEKRCYCSGKTFGMKHTPYKGTFMTDADLEC